MIGLLRDCKAKLKEQVCFEVKTEEDKKNFTKEGHELTIFRICVN